MADLSQEVGQIPGGGKPWGDIYSFGSPEVDKLGERLWQTERLNAVNGNKQRMALQKQMTGEETNAEKLIRGADVPDFTNAYSAYKNASMDFNKNQNNLPIEDRIQQQMNVNNLYGQAMKLVADSKARKALELGTGKDILNPANRNLYADNAGDLITSSMNTPIAKLNAVPITGDDGKPTTVDLTNPNSFLYKSNTDFAQNFKDAQGKQVTLNAPDISKPTDLVHVLTQYKGFNSPQNFYNSLLANVGSDDVKNKVSAGKRMRDFVAQYGNISDNDYATTEAKYNQLVGSPSYQAAYGAQASNPFPASADNTQTGKVAKYLAMNYALNNQPTSEPLYKDNRGNILNDQQLFALKKQAIGLADRKNLFDYEQASTQGKGEQFLENNFNALYNSNGGGLTTKKTDGTTETATVLNAPTALKKAFAGETNVTDPSTGKTSTKEVMPDDIVKLPNGNLKGYYYERDATGNIKKSDDTGQVPQRKDLTPVELNPTTAKDVYGKILASEVKLAPAASHTTTIHKSTSIKPVKIPGL